MFFLLEPCILYVQQDVLGGVSVHIGDLLAWVLYTSHLTCMGDGEWGLAMALAVDNQPLLIIVPGDCTVVLLSVCFLVYTALSITNP